MRCLTTKLAFYCTDTAIVDTICWTRVLRKRNVRQVPYASNKGLGAYQIFEAIEWALDYSRGALISLSCYKSNAKVKV